MYNKKWKPSKTKAIAYAQSMNEIEAFCEQNGISSSSSNDSYYFTLNAIDYRVSNHSIESSNSHAYNRNGEKVRELYHDTKRDNNVVYIHAGKTRIIEIYNDLKNGYKLDGNGYRKYSGEKQ